MPALFNRIRIRAKLPAIMVAITVLAVVGIGSMTTMEARRAIGAEAAERLGGLADSRSEAVRTWLDTIREDLIVQSQSPFVQDAMRSFTAAWRGYGDGVGPEMRRLYATENPNEPSLRWQLENAGDGSNWSASHEFMHKHFVDLQQRRGYADVFLFDPDGNLIYTVAKQDDFALNYVDGPLAASGLGQVFRRAVALAPGSEPAFVDFTRHAPSGGVPASFIARPVTSSFGQLMGVIAYQLPTDQFNELVSDGRGLGRSGRTYIVGKDHFLRSGLRGIAEDAALVRRVGTEAVVRALAGETGSVEGIGAGGNVALSFYQPISFLGADWAMIAEQDTDELLASASRMRTQVFIHGAFAAVVVCIVGLFLSRNISAPLGRVGEAMRRVAQREYDVEVPATDRRDEIGAIATSLKEFRDSLAKAERTSREAFFKGAAFEGSSSPMMMADTEYNITFTNPAMKALFQEQAEQIRKIVPDFDPETLVGRSMDIFHKHPEHQRRLVSDLAKLPFKAEVQLGDAYLTIHVAAVHDSEGNYLGLVTEWQDVTRIRRNAAILGALDAGQVWIDMDQRGEIVMVNENFCKVLGTGKEAALGLNCDEVIAFDGDAAAARAEAEEALAGGRSYSGRFGLTFGERRAVVEGSLTPILDSHRRLTRRILIANDVTAAQMALADAEADRKAAEAAQAKVVEALGSALELLSDGDMTTSIDTGFAPEYERLRADFNRAMGKLLSAMRAVVENSGAIAGEVAGITQASTELSARTENQAATLEETAASLDELTASVKSSAERAVQAARIVDEARGSAEASGTVVREAVAAMGEIADSSRQISKIIGVIDDIAFQTNLLALNAGVEAARAGDAGRGFAVVASEVRALAQRSSEAAREINGLISASGTQVKRGVELVGDTGRALQRIVASVADIAGHVGEIARSSSEQSQGLVEINQAMTQLDQVTQQNAAMFEETSAASRALARAADTLTETVARFRTDAPAAAPVPLRAAPLAPRPEAAPLRRVAGAAPASGPPTTAGGPSSERGRTGAMAPIRALIVDDSRTIRSIIRTLLSRDPGIEVVGEAGDAYQARDAIKALDPDVITLDVEMPRMDGLEFLGHLMRLRPMPVVMVSSQTGKGRAAAIRALSIGAVDCVDRDEIRRDVSGGSRLCAVVRTAARAHVQARRDPVEAPVAEDFRPNGRLLLIGSSTGGVDALERVFSRFPANCPPTLVAQHMPAPFLASFAQRLDDTLRPDVRLATDGEAVAAGTILLAPGGGQHLTVSPAGKPVVRLVREDGTHLHTPCIDMLFDSAVPRGRHVVAAILTGMGRDGAEGLLRLRQAGARTLAQSGRSAVVDGMPRVAREIGAADTVADLDDIAGILLAACGRGRAAA